MSRLAKRAIKLADGVTFALAGNTATVKGPKHELSGHIPARLVTITAEAQELRVAAADASAEARAAVGLVYNLLHNLVSGVQEDFVKELRFAGVGYRAAAEGRKLTLNVGYSHPVVLEAPEGVSVAVQKNIIRTSGPDKQRVGQFAANVRQVRPPEPYKGKGIAYVDEHIRRKAGKAGKAAA